MAKKHRNHKNISGCQGCVGREWKKHNIGEAHEIFRVVNTFCMIL